VTNLLPVPSLLVITDLPPPPQTIENVVLEALSAGCHWIMYREKNASAETFRRTAMNLGKLCEEHEAVLCINGDVGIAQECSAGGVHLQTADDVEAARVILSSRALIGVSCHSIVDVQRAELAGADYVTFSPVFETASKPGYGPALGLEGLAEAARDVSIPLIALAGISSANTGDCIQHGAHGVAVMGGVMQSDDPAGAVKRLITALG
jgi:thiamine-phosphate pyrophosphorylase